MKLAPLPGRLRLVALLLALSTSARGEGPLFVGGTNGVPGKPFVWTINPLTYWTDLGPLGGQTNAQANTLVMNAFQAWQNVPTASINFKQAGQLPVDINGTNIMTAFNQLDNCSTPIDPTNPAFIARDRTVIYDTDGSALTALGEDPTMVLGEASAVCFSSDGTTTNSLQRGFALLNGKATAAQLLPTMIHEFGHLIGLDHSQINLNCLTTFCSGGSDDLAGVPIMFPVAIDPKTTPTTDDVAGVSVLYPETVNSPPGQIPFSTFGRIQGYVLFTDAVTPAQGYNVIARQVDDPATPQNESRRIAVSNVSGFLFTFCVTNPALPPPNNDCGPQTAFGSRDQTLIGFFDIPGLPVDKGQKYTLEVEAINNSGTFPFVFGSSVGPIGNYGFEFPLPGPAPCTPLLLTATPPASCANPVQFAPKAGLILNTGTDIVLPGAPPRYDAWEDGP